MPKPPHGLSFWRASLIGGLAMMLGATTGHGAERWRLDPARTAIRFEVPSAVWGTTQGRFLRFEGRLTLDFANPALSQVGFTVQADSVTTGSGGVDAYIKSEVLFDVVRFPTMSFASRTIEKLDDRTATVTGDMTLHGVTRPLTLRVDVTPKGNGRAAAFSASGIIRRSEFGMDAGVPVVSDNVTFTVVAEAAAP